MFIITTNEIFQICKNIFIMVMDKLLELFWITNHISMLHLMKTIQLTAAENDFDLSTDNLKNDVEAKEKITHFVHENGTKSRIYEKFIDTDTFNKAKTDIINTKK